MSRKIPLSYLNDTTKELDNFLEFLSTQSSKRKCTYCVGNLYCYNNEKKIINDNLPFNFIVPFTINRLNTLDGIVADVIREYHNIDVKLMREYCLAYKDYLLDITLRSNGDFIELELFQIPEDELLKLDLIDNELSKDIEQLNKKIKLLYNSKMGNMKTEIADLVVALYEDKYQRKNKYWRKKSFRFFVKLIFPFIENEEKDWDAKKLENLSYPKKTTENKK